MLKHIRRGAEVVRKKFKQIFLDALWYMYICTYENVCMYTVCSSVKKSTSQNICKYFFTAGYTKCLVKISSNVKKSVVFERNSLSLKLLRHFAKAKRKNYLAKNLTIVPVV